MMSPVPIIAGTNRLIKDLVLENQIVVNLDSKKINYSKNLLKKFKISQNLLKMLQITPSTP